MCAFVVVQAMLKACKLPKGAPNNVCEKMTLIAAYASDVTDKLATVSMLSWEAFFFSGLLHTERFLLGTLRTWKNESTLHVARKHIGVSWNHKPFSFRWTYFSPFWWMIKAKSYVFGETHTYVMFIRAILENAHSSFHSKTQWCLEMPCVFFCFLHKQMAINMYMWLTLKQLGSNCLHTAKEEINKTKDPHFSPAMLKKAQLGSVLVMAPLALVEVLQEPRPFLLFYMHENLRGQKTSEGLCYLWNNQPQLKVG